MDSELRKNPRVMGYAKALLVGAMAPGYIRDMSKTGCQIAFMQPVKAAAGDRIEIQVIAVHDPSLAPFTLKLEVRWLKDDPPWFCLGGEIKSVSCPPEEGIFEKLVAYYEQAVS